MTDTRSAWKVTQTGSPIGRPAVQRKTLIGLGLNKLHRTRVLQDTPSIRGMIAKVAHLVHAEKIDATVPAAPAAAPAPATPDVTPDASPDAAPALGATSEPAVGQDSGTPDTTA